MSINIFWLQRLWPVLRNSGPLISRLADTYVKRGADQKSAEAMAEMAVLLDQILDHIGTDIQRIAGIRNRQPRTIEVGSCSIGRGECFKPAENCTSSSRIMNILQGIRDRARYACTRCPCQD